MCGSGTLGTQKIAATQVLPASTGGGGGVWNDGSLQVGAEASTTGSAGGAAGTGVVDSAAGRVGWGVGVMLGALVVALA